MFELFSDMQTVLVPARLDTVTVRLWGSLPSVLWPWLWAYIGLLISYSGGQKSLCLAPQYYHVSLFLEIAETGLLVGSWHYSIFCDNASFLGLLQGTQGGGQQGQDS